jgi:hypothetical protein
MAQRKGVHGVYKLVQKDIALGQMDKGALRQKKINTPVAS